MPPPQRRRQNSAEELGFLSFVSRHLVALTAWSETLGDDGKPLSKPKFVCYSGTVFSVGGQLCIATAGHVLENLKKGLDHPRVRVSQQSLVDYCGPDATISMPTPFEPLVQPHYFIFDDELGLDFAIILPSPLFQEGMRRNGIVPFGPAQWTYPPQTEFFRCAVIGFPEERLDADHTPDGKAEAGYAVPVLVQLRQVPDDSSTAFPRFKADIVDMGDQKKIEGMSGGPIIGFTRAPDGVRYYLLALQSKEKEKTVYGCPVEQFMRILDAKLNDQQEQREKQQEKRGSN